jgi:N-glycosylase/DNA lyase
MLAAKYYNTLFLGAKPTTRSMIGSLSLDAIAYCRLPSCSVTVESTPTLRQLEYYLPHEESELLPGVKWGHYCQLYTPAFWKFMYLSSGIQDEQNFHRLTSTVIEEIVACLLGGFGMPAELGLAAFNRLQEKDLIEPGTSLAKIKRALSKPFLFSDGSRKQYRFYNQKSKYVFNFLQRDDLDSIPVDDDLEFRNWLLTIGGIGPKTASWVTRNWLQSENVAILDIHVLRAGIIAGIFDIEHDVSSEYFTLETSYLSFCKALDVLPSNMDAIIWNYMKKTNKLALKVITSQDLI